MGSVLGGGSKKAKPAEPYKGAQFQPYTYTSQVGTTTGKPVGSYGYNVESSIDPRLTSLGYAGLQAAEPMFTGYLQEAGRQLPMFGGVDDGEQRARDIFATQSALLQPEFAQQRQQLQSNLFGSGRLGLQLAGETAGAGAGTGMVQPDAYGLGLAQSRALAELSSGARTQAQAEQQQAYQQALQTFATNEAQRQQQAKNLLGGFQGSLGGFASVMELEQALVNQGLNIEAARSAAQQASASSGAALAKAGTPASSGGGLFSSLISGATSALGNTDLTDLYNAVSGGGGGSGGGSKNTEDYAMDAAKLYLMSSDKKLKTNIKKVGQLPSGLTTYTWDWKEEFKHLVGNQPTLGVIAQEAMKLFPKAVSMHPNGYLQVDYARIK